MEYEISYESKLRVTALGSGLTTVNFDDVIKIEADSEPDTATFMDFIEHQVIRKKIVGVKTVKFTKFSVVKRGY